MGWEMTEDYYIGIDLGTTYSCLAFVDDVEDQPTVDKNFEQEETTPSVILFNDNGEIIVGSPAKEMSVMYPADRTVTAIKRKMGEDYKITVDGKEYTPVTLSAAILKKMINDFNDNHACDVKRAVITCPAYFGHEEREATKLAGKVAGLEDVTIINEPTAAAISFGFGHMEGGKKRVMVYDLGGGTFDVTILEIDGNIFTAVATDGERLLGGKDWDAALTKIIVRKIAEQSGIEEEDIEADDDIMQTLVLDSETLKKRLSTAESSRGTISVGGKKIAYNVTRSEFDAATKPLIQATVDIIKRTLDSKGFTESDIDSLLLVGGSSRMPQVRENISEAFPGIHMELYDPDQSVAKGAALLCRSNHNAPKPTPVPVPVPDPVPEPVPDPVPEPVPDHKDETKEEDNLTKTEETKEEEEIEKPEKVIEVHNVLSKSFGICATDEDKNEYISNIIFRNEVLPITAVKTYYPMEDGQLTIKVQIYEDSALNNDDGKRIAIEDGYMVGEFQMELPEEVTRDTPVTVKFIASDEGILTAAVDCMDVHGDYRLQNKFQMSAGDLERSQGLMEKVSR